MQSDLRLAKAKTAEGGLTIGSDFSLVLLIPVSLVWFITSISADSAWEINSLGVQNWLVSSLVGFLLHSILMIGKSLFSRRFQKSRKKRLGWMAETLIIVIAALVSSSAVTMVDGSNIVDLDLILVQLILLLLIIRYGKKLIGYQKLISELSKSQLQLALQKDALVETLTDAVAQAKLREEELRTELESIFASEKLVSEKLWSLSESVIRPLSHKIAEGLDHIAQPRQVIWRPSWKRISTELAKRANFRPLLSGLGTVLVLFGFSVQIGGGENLPEPNLPNSEGLQLVVDTGSMIGFLSQTFLAFVISWLSMSMAKRFFNNPSVNIRIPDTLSRFGVSLLLAALLAMMSSFVLQPVFFPEDPESKLTIPLVIAISVLLFGLIAATSQALNSFTESVLNTIEEENDRLLWETTRLNQQIWQNNRKLGKLMHGPIRSILISSAILWKQDEADKPSLTSLIDYTSGQFKRLEQANQNPLKMLDETIELWGENCQIELRLDKYQREEISLDPIASELMSDLLCDAILNSVVHGGAKNLEIKISRDANKLSVSVTDDGELMANPQPGLGSKMLDENTLGWSLKTDQGKTVLRAEIPFLLTTSSEPTFQV